MARQAGHRVQHQRRHQPRIGGDRPGRRARLQRRRQSTHDLRHVDGQQRRACSTRPRGCQRRGSSTKKLRDSSVNSDSRPISSQISAGVYCIAVQAFGVRGVASSAAATPASTAAKVPSLCGQLAPSKVTAMLAAAAAQAGRPTNIGTVTTNSASTAR